MAHQILAPVIAMKSKLCIKTKQTPAKDNMQESHESHVSSNFTNVRGSRIAIFSCFRGVIRPHTGDTWAAGKDKQSPVDKSMSLARFIRAMHISMFEYFRDILPKQNKFQHEYV